MAEIAFETGLTSNEPVSPEDEKNPNNEPTTHLGDDDPNPADLNNDYLPYSTKKFFEYSFLNCACGIVHGINIDRKKDPNNKISFQYPEKFDIQKIIQTPMEISDYFLTTVIKKDNDNYIAFCWNCIDKQWYAYNNEKINLINNYKSYIFDDKKACILIYTGNKKN